MSRMMSACGVMCSSCPAYRAESKGPAYQARVAAAWRRIYQLREKPENISCGGCLGPEDKLFDTSKRCAARRCCVGNTLTSCAACPRARCENLERAQSVWDGVPALESKLSAADFRTYARPYCGHRERLAARRARRQRSGASRTPSRGR